MRTATEALAEMIPVSRACAALDYPRSSLYRQRQPTVKTEPRSRPTPPRALSPEEKRTVLAVLDSERFQDQAPHQVYGTLLDEGVYHCSISTMYRILRANDQVRERRNQRQQPEYTRPELLANEPNQLWSWDITKLRGPVTWTYYYLYVLLDVFSRFVVGWLLAKGESAELAEQLIAESCARQAIDADQLTLHADRGSAMTSKTVAQLLIDLNVTQSHSRPYTPDDNPFSEAQFKTLKYRPDYPDRFEDLDAARVWARAFFDWYNNHHRHSSLGLMTPATVHYGQAAALTAQRQVTLQAAYHAHPERFVNGVPRPPQVSQAVWINPPRSVEEGGL
jgi:putative transposase